jgi:S-DNA-T family DNA segregation ATPase FtsK/SpoIIIE
MAQVAAAIAKDRKSRYAGLTAASGGDLLPVTHDLSQITIVVDESAEVDDDPEARSTMDALLKVQRIGRAEGVNVFVLDAAGNHRHHPGERAQAVVVEVVWPGRG